MMRPRYTAYGSVAFLALLALVLVGCMPGMSGATTPSRLRVRNDGDIKLERIVVIFPDERVTFGPLLPGSTSAYQTVQLGVYETAAFEVLVDSRTLEQAVIDWVGARPLAGGAFTCAVVVDPRQPVGLNVRGEIRRD